MKQTVDASNVELLEKIRDKYLNRIFNPVKMDKDKIQAFFDKQYELLSKKRDYEKSTHFGKSPRIFYYDNIMAMQRGAVEEEIDLVRLNPIMEKIREIESKISAELSSENPDTNFIALCNKEIESIKNNESAYIVDSKTFPTTPKEVDLAFYYAPDITADKKELDKWDYYNIPVISELIQFTGYIFENKNDSDRIASFRDSVHIYGSTSILDGYIQEGVDTSSMDKMSEFYYDEKNPHPNRKIICDYYHGRGAVLDRNSSCPYTMDGLFQISLFTLLAQYEYMKELGLVNLPTFNNLLEFADLGIFTVTSFEDRVHVCAMPIDIKLDEEYRLNSVTGCAITFADGEGVSFVHGYNVPNDYITNPDAITKEIYGKANAELKRCIVELKGLNWFASIFNLKEVDKAVINDQEVILYEGKDDENEIGLMKFVRVICNSTDRDYYITVPEDIKGAIEGVAWTFNKTPDEYVKNLVFES